MDLLLVSFTAPIAVGIYLLAKTHRTSRWRIARHLAGVILVALPGGGLAYLYVGIEIARVRGVGHFFSVPFGGYAVSDVALITSLGTWFAFFAVLVGIVFRKKLKP